MSDENHTTGEREALAERAAEKALKKAQAAAAATPTPTSSAEAEQALQWQECEKCGPVWKLRAELKEQHAEREKAMKKAIALATFILATVTGGIQIWGAWGKVTATSMASAEMVQALRELRAEVKTATSSATQTLSTTK